MLMNSAIRKAAKENWNHDNPETWRAAAIRWSDGAQTPDPVKVRARRRNWNKKNPAKARRGQLRQRSKVNGWLFNLELKEFQTWWDANKCCEYCRIPEVYLPKVYNTTRDNRFYTLTIDRKDNLGIYELNNIAKACWACNAMKGTVFSYEEMKEIGLEVGRAIAKIVSRRVLS